MELLQRGEYFVAWRDPDARIVRLDRTAAAFPSLEEADRGHREVLELVLRTEVRGYSLLLDSRAAPGRNDPGFEQVIGRYRDRLFEPFKRRALLVRSQAGLMHIQRLSKEHLAPTATFVNEGEALAYLRSAEFFGDGNGASRPPKAR